MGRAVLVGQLLLLFQIHAAVRFCKELFRIFAVLGILRATHAEREYVFATNFNAGLLGQRKHLRRFLFRRIRIEARRDDDKFVAAHAGDVVILTATVFERLGKQAQHAIAFEVTEAVVDLLEAVHVGDHYGQRRVLALAAGEIAIQLQEQRTGIGKARQVVGGRGVFRLLTLS